MSVGNIPRHWTNRQGTFRCMTVMEVSPSASFKFVCVFVFACAPLHVCAAAHVWRSEDHFQE